MEFWQKGTGLNCSGCWAIAASGNNKADELVRQGLFECYLGPKSVLEIPKCITCRAVKLWIKKSKPSTGETYRDTGITRLSSKDLGLKLQRNC